MVEEEAAGLTEAREASPSVVLATMVVGEAISHEESVGH